MSEETFEEVYNECCFHMENGSFDELESMNLDKVYTLAKQEIDIHDSPTAHYLLAVYYNMQGNKESAIAENLKAAYLGHCTSAIDYSNTKGADGEEILGIAKAMNDAGEHLASEQENINYYMDKIDAEKKAKVLEIAENIKKNMQEKNLKFFW